MARHMGRASFDLTEKGGFMTNPLTYGRGSLKPTTSSALTFGNHSFAPPPFVKVIFMYASSPRKVHLVRETFEASRSVRI